MKFILVLLLASLPATCQTIGTDLGVIAANLPQACGNASAFLTQVSTTPGVAANVQKAAATANAKYAKYCGPAAVTVADTAAAVAALQQIISDVQNVQAGK